MPFFWRAFNVVCCLNNGDIQILNQNQNDKTIHQEMHIFKIINLGEVFHMQTLNSLLTLARPTVVESLSAP